MSDLATLLIQALEQRREAINNLWSSTNQPRTRIEVDLIPAINYISVRAMFPVNLVDDHIRELARADEPESPVSSEQQALVSHNSATPGGA